MMDAPECLGAYLWVKGNLSSNITSKAELQAALNLAGCNPSAKALTAYWQDGKGEMSYKDFIHIVDKEQTMQIESLVKAFVQLGGKSDGTISYSELMAKLQTKEEALSADEIQSLGNLLQPDDNGNVNYLQICAALSLALRQCNRVMEQKVEQEAQSYRVNSRTYTRKKANTVSGSDTVDALHSQPLDIQNWVSASTRGCFYVEPGGHISSHSYTLNLQEDTPVWITIKPFDLYGEPPAVDTELLLFGDGENSGRPLGCTSQKDHEGVFSMGLALQRGNYLLVPFTTGCYIKPRQHQPDQEVPLIARSKVNGSPLLTPPCIEALEAIFHYSDLDCNGLLGRKEFDLFCLRTSGEAASDEEWASLEANFSTQDGQLTLEGFIALHEMDVIENRGNIQGLHTTLSKLGYNQALVLDQAFPFLITVYTMKGIPTLGTLPVSEKGGLIDKALCRLAVEQGSTSKVRNLNDLTLHVLRCLHRSTIAVRNKSHSTVTVKLDCSGSANCITHRKSLDYVTEIPPRSSVIGHHLLPEVEGLPWTVNCQESLV